MSELTCTTVNAIRNARAFKDAYNKAERAAIKGIVTDVLGEEWTKKQFDAVTSWGVILAAHGLRGAIDVPSVSTLRDWGWLDYRVEEFELPEEVKRQIAAKTVTLTMEGGAVETLDAFFNPWVEKVGVGGTYRRERIVKIEYGRPGLKGRRYVYRFI